MHGNHWRKSATIWKYLWNMHELCTCIMSFFFLVKWHKFFGEWQNKNPQGCASKNRTILIQQYMTCLGKHVIVTDSHHYRHPAKWGCELFCLYFRLFCTHLDPIAPIISTNSYFSLSRPAVCRERGVVNMNTFGDRHLHHRLHFQLHVWIFYLNLPSWSLHNLYGCPCHSISVTDPWHTSPWANHELAARLEAT